MERTALSLQFSWPSSFSVCFIFGPRCAAHVGSRFPEQEWSSVAPAGDTQESQALGRPGGVLPREYQLFPADFWRWVQQEVPSGREGPSQGPSPCFLLQMGDQPTRPAPSLQGFTPLHCLGVPTGPLSVRERPPTSSGRCHGPPSPGW